MFPYTFKQHKLKAIDNSLIKYVNCTKAPTMSMLIICYLISWSLFSSGGYDYNHSHAQVIALQQDGWSCVDERPSPNGCTR